MSVVATPRLILSSPAHARPGDVVTIVLSIDSMLQTDMAGLMWTLPAGAVVSGPQPSTPDKSVVCSQTTCILVGVVPAPIGGVLRPGSVFNGLPIKDGQVQAFNFAIPTSAVPGTVLTVTPTGTYGVSSDGSSVTITIVPVDITALHPFDLNADGLVDDKDVQQQLNKWLNSKSNLDFALMVQLMSYLQK